MTDYIFKCPTSRLASSFRDANVPAYVYSFEHVSGFSLLKGACYGVSHTDEIPYIFPATLPILAGTYQFTPAEANLSVAMMTSWARFAATKNPTNSLASFPTWGTDLTYTTLNLGISSSKGFRKEYCEFWNGSYKPAAPLHWGIWIVVGVGSAAIVAAAAYLIYRYVRYRNQYTRLAT